jgi:DNA excision repair protein ERCC-4
VSPTLRASRSVHTPDVASVVVLTIYGTTARHTAVTTAAPCTATENKQKIIMQKIIVDSRETTSGIPRLLTAMGTPFEMQEMSCGDYKVGEFLIERKSVADFSASILDGRLFEQAELLSAASDKPMLLIEGDLASCNRDFHADALPGALSAMAVFWGLQLVCTVNQEATCRLLSRMFKHQTEGLGYEVATRVAKPKERPDGALAQYLVCGLPGVGPEMGRALLKYFGSARSVFAATEAELRSCKGVGPKTASAIATALDQSPTAFRVTKTAPKQFGY